MAFLYDARRVKPSGLAAELVVSIKDGAKVALDRQFARTPYAVSFLSGRVTFILVTLHVIHGKAPADRIVEPKAIADWLADWGAQVNDFNQNLICLGDFNIDRAGDPLYQAFVSIGLKPPPELDGLPRTILDKPGAEHHFDQIAWFQRSDGSPPRLEPPLRYEGNAGHFDFTTVLLHGDDRVGLSWRISDHYPMWVEFEIRPAIGQGGPPIVGR